MAYKQYFAGTDPIVNRGITERDDVPNISTDLDSVRAYQWEVNFFFDKNYEKSTKIENILNNINKKNR